MLHSLLRESRIKCVGVCLAFALIGCRSSVSVEPVSDPKELDRLLGTDRVDAGHVPNDGHRFIHFGTGRVVMIYNGDAGNMARVYSIVNGKAVTPPLKHAERVLHATLSPDGRRVLT